MRRPEDFEDVEAYVRAVGEREALETLWERATLADAIADRLIERLTELVKAVVGEPPAERPLVVAYGENTYPLTEGGLLVGRGAACQIRLPDKFASLTHAKVYLRDGCAYVEDVASTNGTSVNGRRIYGPVPLVAGDVLTVGRSQLPIIEAEAGT